MTQNMILNIMVAHDGAEIAAFFSEEDYTDSGAYLCVSFLIWVVDFATSGLFVCVC
jgi:hypothetical protein